jgi:hypothetical protein
VRHTIEIETPTSATELASTLPWLEREKALLVVEHPAVDRLVRWVWARPAALLLPLAFVIMGSLGAVIPDGDAGWFREAGRGMLGANFWNVFSQPGLQIGPLYLIALGSAAAAVDAVGLPVLFTLAGLQAALVAWLGLVTARRFADHTGASKLPAQWAVGLALVLGGLLAESIGNGHPEEIALGLILANAALDAGRGRRSSVGLLVGLAGGLKLWGVLGIPVVLIGRRPRDIWVRGLVTATFVLLCYGPFFLWGEVKTFTFTWGMSNAGSTLAQLGSWLGASDWTLRVIQGAAAILVGCAVAVRRSGSGLAIVICVIATRLLLDPLLMSYYPGPLVVLVLLWAWTDHSTRASRWRFIALAAVPVLVLVPYLIPLEALKGMWTVAMIVVPLAILRTERRAARRAPGGVVPVAMGRQPLSTL